MNFFRIYYTSDARRDLREIGLYIKLHDSVENANYVVSRIGSVVESLKQNPSRGNYPSELLDKGIKDYREVFFKPYRIVYKVENDRVQILLIADGRRDMKELLNRRLS